ncbi:hypothetical protein AAZX31_19G148300 [Glycine max]|uniref:Uncharacterized protein n=2 Tax=Glycine subgen. Soja TaxID=1462606 RepID=I1N9N8_SOYBN|nr:uncharacterized protein LOC113000476 [Glycine max]KAG4916150.1 hypothetical protein JHK87_053707 [Glycine soja]KAG4913211.1 hypothetical protein JHK86_053644 [Glycine max]KAG4928110.1 hypothetical protein JHK85_054596 [Glycine max]KAG5083631.1 hypothetical protein JHK84_053669 [Glycine max]KAG5086399.1 hypothetical protein JHK82_053796 [Glycine max]|eukprot:XP_025982995.1 uncharacterized protein LOC113000476 [Glycine max]
MALSHRRILFTVLQIILFTLIIFVASPESGVACRPLFLHYQWSWDYGLLMQSLPNAPAPPSTGDSTHP